MRTKIPYAIQFVFFFILTFILYRGYIDANLVPVNEDGIVSINHFFLSSHRLHTGAFPLWNPYMTAGRTCVGDFTTLIFYPVRILFSFLPPLLFFYAFYAFHLAFGSLFFTKYLEVLGLDKKLAFAASIVYYFSIYLGGYRKEHILIIASSVYLPAVLYCLELYLAKDSLRHFLAAALLMAVQLTAGFPQYSLYTILFSGLYLISGIIRFNLSIKKWFCDCIISGLTYLGLSMVILIPYAQMNLTFKKYGSSGIAMDYFQLGSLHPIKYLIMIWPTIFGVDPNHALLDLPYAEFQSELFAGTLIFILMIYAIVRIHDRFVVSMVVMAVPIMIYACTGASSLLSRIMIHLPLIKSLRCHARALYIVTFIVTTLGFYGLDHILKKTEIKRYLISVSIVILATVVQLYPYWIPSNQYDMSEYGMNTPVEEFLVSHREDGKVIMAYPYGDRLYESPMKANAQLALQIYAINSYTTFNDPRLSRLLENGSAPSFNSSGVYIGLSQILERLKDANDALSMLGIRYIIDQEGLMPDVPEYYDVAFKDGNTVIYENKNCKDLLYVPDRVELIESDEEIYGHISDFDLDDVSYIVSNGTTPVTADAGLSGLTTISNTKYTGNSVSAVISSTDDTFVNFSQADYPGWRAYVDGKRTTLYEVNGYIQGMAVSAGDHTIEFRYVPVSVIVGLAISIATLICLIFYLKRSSHSRQDSPTHPK